MTVREITRGSAAQAGIALSILLYALRESLDVRSIENGEPYTAESVLRGRCGAPVRSRSLRRDATDPLRLPEQRSRSVGSEGLSQRLSPLEPDCFLPVVNPLSERWHSASARIVRPSPLCPIRGSCATRREQVWSFSVGDSVLQALNAGHFRTCGVQRLKQRVGEP